MLQEEYFNIKGGPQTNKVGNWVQQGGRGGRCSFLLILNDVTLSIAQTMHISTITIQIFNATSLPFQLMKLITHGVIYL